MLAAAVNPWILLKSQARHEKQAAECIGRYTDLDSYVPRFWNRSARQIQLLFPSYIFVKLSSDGQFHFLRQIPFVRSIMTLGENPVRAGRAVNALKERENKNGLVTIPYQSFKRDSPVRITAGPFINSIAAFQYLHGHDRVVVLLQALGMVDLHANMIEAANVLRREKEVEQLRVYAATEQRRRAKQRRQTHRIRKRNMRAKQQAREQRLNVS